MPLKIKPKRIHIDMTQKELAQKSEVSQCYLSQIESGVKQPSFKVLGRIAKALGVSVAELLDEEE